MMHRRTFLRRLAKSGVGAAALEVASPALVSLWERWYDRRPVIPVALLRGTGYMYATTAAYEERRYEPEVRWSRPDPVAIPYIRERGVWRPEERGVAPCWLVPCQPDGWQITPMVQFVHPQGEGSVLVSPTSFSARGTSAVQEVPVVLAHSVLNGRVAVGGLAPCWT